MTHRTVVLVHGMFLTYRCWDSWVSRFASRGYRVVAVPWPGRTASVEELRRQVDPNLAKLGYEALVSEHARAIAQISEPPILIGHSLGGLLVQSLLQRGLGAVGVAVDSAPPRGVSVGKFSFVRSNWPVINPLLSSDRPYTISFPRFQYAFVNGWRLEDQRGAFDSQVVPESLRVPRESRSEAQHIDFHRPHAPLLFVAGAVDHIIPPELNRKNYDRYHLWSTETVDYHEFPGRNHYGVIAGSGWEEVADFCIDWAERRVPVPA
jgi:pimeloyl-ACP methyl ester carboxylesterase